MTKLSIEINDSLHFSQILAWWHFSKSSHNIIDGENLPLQGVNQYPIFYIKILIQN